MVKIRRRHSTAFKSRIALEDGPNVFASKWRTGQTSP